MICLHENLVNTKKIINLENIRLTNNESFKNEAILKLDSEPQTNIDKKIDDRWNFIEEMKFISSRESY